MEIVNFREGKKSISFLDDFRKVNSAVIQVFKIFLKRMNNNKNLGSN